MIRKQISLFISCSTFLLFIAGCEDAKTPKRNPVAGATVTPEPLGGATDLAAQCASKNQVVDPLGKECVEKLNKDPLAKLKARCVAENKVVNAEQTDCISEADALTALEAQCKLDKKEVAANKTECAATPISPEVLALEAKCKTENKVLSPDKKSCVEAPAPAKPGDTKPGEKKPGDTKPADTKPPVADPGAMANVITSLFSTFVIATESPKKNCSIPKGAKVTLMAAPTQSTKNTLHWAGKLKSIVGKDEKVIPCALTDAYFIASQFTRQ